METATDPSQTAAPEAASSLEPGSLEPGSLEPGSLEAGAREGARALTRQGMDAALAGDLRGAIELYDAAIQSADHLPALVNRACAHFHLGDYPRAIRDCGWALEVDPEQHYMWLVRGLARLRAEDAAGAGRDLDRYLSVGRAARHRKIAERALRRLAAA